MSWISRIAIAATMACLPLLARAEGKCDDDPRKWQGHPDKKDRLVVAWSIPLPADARIDDDLAAELIQLLDAKPGGGSWQDFALPPEYESNVHRTEIFRDPIHPGAREGRAGFDALPKLEGWLNAHFSVPLQPEARPLLSGYLGGGSKVFSFVVEHPPRADDAIGFRFCTCMLQRAAVVLRGSREELWVQTRFQTARDSNTFVNFEPRKPVVFTFNLVRGKDASGQPATGLWFPLALNRVLPLPGKPAWLRADLLVNVKETRKLDPIPPEFSSMQRGTVQYAGETWNVTRIWKRYERSDPANDLFIAVK